MSKVSTGVSVELARLRERIERLEAEVRAFKQAIHGKFDSEAVPWWQAIAGIFDGDLFFEQAALEGRKWRESQHPKARAKAKSPKVKAKRADS